MTHFENTVSAKRSPAVLRMDILQILSKYPDKKVLVFEGIEDVGVYSVWIPRFKAGNWYWPLPGRGKKQLVGLLNQLKLEDSDLLRQVRFFVDHDYDGVSDDSRCDQLFVTDQYSIENYLCNKQMVELILCNELRCASEIISHERVLEAFDNFFKSLLNELAEAMAIYRAGVLSGANAIRKPDKLHDNLHVEFESVRVISAWNQIILFDVELRQEIVSESLDYIMRNGANVYRGKWLFLAFRKWLGMLYADRRSDRPVLFSTNRNDLGSDLNTIDIQTLAARSATPNGLDVFIRAA